MLFDILSEIVRHDDILLIIRNNTAISEIRSNSMSIKQKEKWITIGDNDGPAHMHINSELIRSCKFVTEEKPERTSYGVFFFDEQEQRVLAAFFTKMYDENNNLDPARKRIYDSMSQKFGSTVKF
ncbi:MAG: hemin-degrading factor [Nitrosarchaeum sp.]|nr:hemin-degrading factor [Nitrosarchaeum sp.]